MMSLEADVLDHYNLGLEGRRLDTTAGLEFLRTRDVLSRVLPAVPATVYDIGGAEGIYALPLAAEGYSVSLIDPVALHVEAAQDASSRASAPLASITVGDARDLPFDDDSADAVLMLGPLYHLVTAGERARALAEARRVLRPGGRMVCAAISRFASFHDGIERDLLADAVFGPMVMADLHSGVHRNPDVTAHPEWFTLAYFHRPDELADELATGGFRDIDLYAVEGLGASATPATLKDPPRLEALLRALAITEQEPSLLGASPHVLGVATAP